MNCSHCYDAGQDDILVQTLTKSTTEDFSDSQPTTQISVRKVPKNSKEEFRFELVSLAKKKLYGDFSCAPSIGHPFLTMKTIDGILKRLNFIKSEKDLVDLVEDTTVRMEIMSIVQDFFRDVPEEYCSQNLLHVFGVNPALSSGLKSKIEFLSLGSGSDDDDNLENEIDDMSFLE